MIQLIHPALDVIADPVDQFDLKQRLTADKIPDNRIFPEQGSIMQDIVNRRLAIVNDILLNLFFPMM
jgi:hypothetical protein